MIFPTLVATGTFLYFQARERPRVGFVAGAASWFVFTTLGQPRLTLFEALFEPRTLIAFAFAATAYCVLFVPAWRRLLWTRWSYRRTRRRGGAETGEGLAPFTSWERDLDAGRGTAAVQSFLEQLVDEPGPRPHPATDGTPAGALRLGPHAVEVALEEREGPHEPGTPESFGEAWGWALSHRLLGLELPEEWTGQGLDADECAAAVRRASSHTLERGVALALGNLGSVLGLVLRYGSAHQRVHWVPRVSSGDVEGAVSWIGSAAEAATGASGSVTGRVAWAGEANETTALVLDGEVTSIPFVGEGTSRLIAVAVRIEDPDRLLERDAPAGTTVVLIPESTPGVAIQRDKTESNSLPSITLRLRQAALPMESVLGGPEQIGQGHDPVQMSRGVLAAVALPSLAAGLAQREARFASCVESVDPSSADTGATRDRLARIAVGAYRLNALSRAMAHASASRILSPSEIRSAVELARFELRSVLDAGDALLAPRVAAGALPARRLGADVIECMLAPFGPDDVAPLGAALSASVTREKMAAVTGDWVEFDAAYAEHACATAAGWIRAIARSARALFPLRSNAGSGGAPLDEAIHLYGIIAAAVGRATAPGRGAAPRGARANRLQRAADDLCHARRTLTGAITSAAMHVADGHQASERSLFESSQARGVLDALDALRAAAGSLPASWTRAMAPVALGAARRRAVAATPAAEHAVHALTGNRYLLAQLTRDVHVEPDLEAWDRAASVAWTARGALASLARAQERGQLPEGEVHDVLQLAVTRGLISERDRHAVEARGAATAMFEPGAAGSDRAAS